MNEEKWSTRKDRGETDIMVDTLPRETVMDELSLSGAR